MTCDMVESLQRRERKHVPLVDESVGAVESTLDALVVEAVRPLRPDTSAVAAVERWLEAHA